MKKVFIGLTLILTLAVLYFTGFISLLFGKTQAINSDVFTPSLGLFNTLTQTPVDYSKLTVANNNFDEFIEKTIDPAGFYLRIDKIGLFKAIIPNVDPRYKEEYVKSWNYGISHGKFTATPDKIGITYLFAHAVGNKDQASAQNAWFSYLDLLETGDRIIVYYNHRRYIYFVSQISVVSPDATGFYTGESPVAKIRMQFCGPPTGSLSNRTLIDAILSDVQEFTVPN